MTMIFFTFHKSLLNDLQSYSRKFDSKQLESKMEINGKVVLTFLMALPFCVAVCEHLVSCGYFRYTAV